MVRRSLSTPTDDRYNQWGQDTWTHPDEGYDRVLEREDRAVEWAGRPETHCPVCAKPSDEDVAA